MNFAPPNPESRTNLFQAPYACHRVCHPYCNFAPCKEVGMNPQEFAQWCESLGIGPLLTDSPNG